MRKWLPHGYLFAIADCISALKKRRFWKWWRHQSAEQARLKKRGKMRCLAAISLCIYGISILYSIQYTHDQMYVICPSWILENCMLCTLSELCFDILLLGVRWCEKRENMRKLPSQMICQCHCYEPCATRGPKSISVNSHRASEISARGRAIMAFSPGSKLRSKRKESWFMSQMMSHCVGQRWQLANVYSLLYSFCFAQFHIKCANGIISGWKDCQLKAAI